MAMASRGSTYSRALSARKSQLLHSCFLQKYVHQTRVGACIRLLSISSFASDSSEVSQKQELPQSIERIRNIGIAAHIDSGKTSLTERILFYTGRINAIHEVRGKDGVGAKMDFMELEREKGITIQSAATQATWNSHTINIIDTPGHIDFTVEVERALRVLDGAILVICGVSGVQSQSLTVNRQMARYGVPRITFINKLDRAGANPWSIIKQVESKLGTRCAAVQIPIGLESDLSGLVDLVKREAVYFEGSSGTEVRRGSIPDDLVDLAEEKRLTLIEVLADVDEQFGDLYLENHASISEVNIQEAVRRATLASAFSPVMMGSALKNTGVQTLLDGAVEYLPHPGQRRNIALKQVPVVRVDVDGNPPRETATSFKEDEVALVSDASAPLVSLAFKLEEGRFGQLTYLRIYRGTLRRGEFVVNTRTGKKMKVPRLVQMHAGDMEDINHAAAGDICAIFGLECASGDTFVAANHPEKLTMESLFVPEPVMSLAIEPASKATGSGNFTKALSRFCREDPTFRVRLDPESKETVISGMGELHLDVYVQRMAREYDVKLNVGAPRVNYRETVQARAEFNYLHKKQSGGSGQYAGVIGYIEPTEDGKSTEFLNAMVGNNIPPGFFPAIQKGFQEALEDGSLAGYVVQGIRMVITDGRTHSVDSNELAFRMAAIQGFRQAFMNAKPTILEPIMNVAVQIPNEFQGGVIGGISKRRGIISSSTPQGEFVTIETEVPLGDMFGYSTELRSVTQGKGEYTMEYREHRPAPGSEIERLSKEHAEKRAAGR
jgi:elongation factor G